MIGGTSYTTVSDALAAAVNGDTISISGVITDTLTIDKSVTLLGTDPTTDIIQGASMAGTAPKRVVTIAPVMDTLNITIENLGIRYGKATANGGGINIDKNPGHVTLKNLIIEQNETTRNGGGISAAGSSVDIIECTIQNNTCTVDGGGVIVAPNNALDLNPQINIMKSLIAGNSSRHAAGIYINGNKDFGNDNLIDVHIENSTIVNNVGSGPAGGAGGGAIWSKCAFWTQDGTTGNISLTLVHTTIYNNEHTSLVKSGLQFTSAPAGAQTNLKLYNSIVVSNNDLSRKAVNFANANVEGITNCILGGLNAVGTALDDTTQNNIGGRTATYAGIDTVLSDQGGKVQVLALPAGANAVDYCTVAVTGVTLPSTDARDASRDATPDAGAFEYVAPNVAPTVANAIADTSVQEGFGTLVFDLSNVFDDANGDMLTYSSSVSGDDVVTASITGTDLTLTETDSLGADTVSVTASDGNGGSVSTSFVVTVTGIIDNIQDLETLRALKVYPNPIENNEFYLSIDEINFIEEIQLFNVQGQMIPVSVERDVDALKVNISDLAKGLYFLQVTYKGARYTKRLIK
jgi:hypothetical protein